MPAAPAAPSAPDPDERADVLTEHELCARGVDPILVPIVCPWATERRALDGSRCWLAALWEGA